MIDVNEAGVQFREPKLIERVKLAWRVFLHIFRPGIYHDIHREIDQYGRIVIAGWIRKPGDVEYKYHYVTYDGKTAPSAYVEGVILQEVSKVQPKRVGRVIQIEQS